MRRSLIAVVLSLLTLSLVLAACGDDDASTDTPMGSMPGQRAGAMREGLNQYPPMTGVPLLRQAVSRKIESLYGHAYDADSEITVTAGEDVAIVLSSDDLLHDFTIDDIDVHVAADGGETAEGGLRADEPGEYTFYCTVAGHREAGMEGTLVVEEP